MADNDLIPPQIANGGAGSAPTAGRVTAPDYRQIQNPAEVDVRGVDRAASSAGEAGAARAAALSNVFKEFESTAFDAAGKLQSQAGQLAGAQAGLNPNFKPKTGLQAATVYGSSYDAAAHSTYVTSSQLALEKQLGDIEQSNVGNPDGFSSAATAAVQGSLKNMDPLYVPEMTNWAQSRIAAGLNRQNAQKAEDVRNTALATYQSSAPDLITGALHTAAALPGPAGDAVIQKLYSDNQDKLNALVQSRTITPEQGVTLHNKFVSDADSQMSGQKIGISLQPALQAMRTNVETADKMILQDDPNLTDSELQTRQAEYEKARGQWQQAQTRAHVDDLAAVHQSLAAGLYGTDIEGQLRSLYKGGALSEEGYFSAMGESLRNQRDALEDQASMRLVDDAVHGTGPRLDPKDPNAAKAADKYFQTHVAMSGNVSDPQYAIGAAEFVRQTGIVPKSVQGQIRVGLLSGDPTQTARAAALAAKITRENPEADVFVGTPKLAAIASMVNDNLSVGLSPQQSLTTALKTTEIPPEQKKIREQHYAADVKTGGGNNKALQDQLQSQDGHFWNHAPQAPVGMQAAFDGLVHQLYASTGDIGKARELAGNQLKLTWGVSKVNGTPEYQQFPIKDADVPTVRADIAASVKDAGYTGDPSAIHLTPNENTTLTGGRSYTLTHVDAQTGAADVLLDKNNRPLRYDLPVPQDFSKSQQALAGQKIAQAKTLRDQQRANSLDQDQYEKQLADMYLSGNSQQQRQAGR